MKILTHGTWLDNINCEIRMMLELYVYSKYTHIYSENMTMSENFVKL